MGWWQLALGSLSVCPDATLDHIPRMAHRPYPVCPPCPNHFWSLSLPTSENVICCFFLLFFCWCTVVSSRSHGQTQSAGSVFLGCMPVQRSTFNVQHSTVGCFGCHYSVIQNTLPGIYYIPRTGFVPALTKMTNEKATTHIPGEPDRRNLTTICTRHLLTSSHPQICFRATRSGRSSPVSEHTVYSVSNTSRSPGLFANHISLQTRRASRSVSRPSAGSTRSRTRRSRWNSPRRASTRGYRNTIYTRSERVKRATLQSSTPFRCPSPHLRAYTRRHSMRTHQKC
jgi:hypothetical protein